jgi:hypothetical protein
VNRSQTWRPISIPEASGIDLRAVIFTPRLDIASPGTGLPEARNTDFGKGAPLRRGSTATDRVKCAERPPGFDAERAGIGNRGGPSREVIGKAVANGSDIPRQGRTFAAATGFDTAAVSNAARRW